MPSNQNEAFLREQQQAVERMREMSRRSLQQSPHKMPPSPSFVRLPENGGQTMQPIREEPAEAPPEKQQVSPPKRTPHNNSQSPLSGLLPKRLSVDADTALILGLILLLSQENTDRMLLYALVYILL